MQALVRAHDRAVLRLPETAFVPLVRTFGGDHLGEIHALQAGKFLGGPHRGGGVDLLAGHDAPGLRALLAKDACELAGVDAGDGDDLVTRQEFAQVFVLRQLLASGGTSLTTSPAA